MLSTDLATVLDNIEQLRKERSSWQAAANTKRAREKDYADEAKEAEQRVAIIDGQIDKQQLLLRKVLSGEESTVAVPPVATGEPDQVGREG